MLGRMLLTSNSKTQAAFDEMTPRRLGNWRPGQKPTKELLTLISSRMKNQKAKAVIREGGNPVVPSLLLEKKQTFNEEEDRVRTINFPTCWRCSQRCQFCIKKKKRFPKFGNFSMEIANPFLDVLEEILDNEDQEDEEDEDEAELMSTEEVEKNFNNLMRCLSGNFFQKMMMTRWVMRRRTRRTRRMTWMTWRWMTMKWMTMKWMTMKWMTIIVMKAAMMKK
ncbi:hypothetical protein OS493_028528 [Desmophyllum pertusum]|uniref:Uncharacterized protein n=1 Tax=Desmophyllum pertusum TaxID=174260 RepID=A0A9W9ZA28_9CNID|nr:hypothetical protein OS493_028528 [Desmophyllum pertusum]